MFFVTCGHVRSLPFTGFLWSICGPFTISPIRPATEGPSAVVSPVIFSGSVANLIGPTIVGSSLTRVEIGHMRSGSAGNGLIKSRGSGSSPSQRAQSAGARITGMRS
jgi:hypothetical protein